MPGGGTGGRGRGGWPRRVRGTRVAVARGGSWSGWLAAAGAWYSGCRGAWERCMGGRERGGRLRRERGTRVAVVRCALLVVRVLHGFS